LPIVSSIGGGILGEACGFDVLRESQIDWHEKHGGGGFDQTELRLLIVDDSARTQHHGGASRCPRVCKIACIAKGQRSDEKNEVARPEC